MAEKSDMQPREVGEISAILFYISIRNTSGLISHLAFTEVDCVLSLLYKRYAAILNAYP